MKQHGTEHSPQGAARGLGRGDDRPFRETTDGIDHINIYSQGKSELGRLLAGFTRSPFKHPFYGPFASMEGFWFYMRAAVKDDKLRELWGWRAKAYGREIPPDWPAFFREDILAAHYQKIIQNEELRRSFVSSELPFTMYYLYGEGRIQIEDRNGAWLVDGFEKMRYDMQANRVPECWEVAAKRYVSDITDH